MLSSACGQHGAVPRAMPAGSADRHHEQPKNEREDLARGQAGRRRGEPVRQQQPDTAEDQRGVQICMKV